MKKRNTQNTMTVLMLGMVLALLSSCNSDLGSISGSESGSGVPDGVGEIRISLGGPAQSRTAVPDAAELAVMSIEVELTSTINGSVINRTFGPGGGTIELASGTWQLTAKAYNDDPRLRGFAEETIPVNPGSSHSVTLKSCIGVSTEAELKAVFDANSSFYTRYPWDTTNGDLIVLEQNIPAPVTIAPTDILRVRGPRRVTIIAEPGTTRTLTAAAFAVENGGSLTLGKAGETGGLVFDGYSIDYGDLTGYGAFALHVTGTDTTTNPATSSNLTINGNTEIKNCTNSNGQGGAITVKDGSSLIINGGDIRDNKNIDSSSGNSSGGAIYVEDSTFVMTGGIIQNNSAINRGGGVYIAATSGQASFTMSNGEIKNNIVGLPSTSPGTTVAQGGGVWHSGEFTMSGGTISGNSASDPAAAVYGGGIYQEYQVPNSYSNRFTMTDGTVTSNTATHTGTSAGIAHGGGIMGSSNLSNMDLTGGTISYNTASVAIGGDAQGGGIYCAGILTLTNSNTIGAVEIKGNIASTGGGVYSSTASLNFNGTTISNNNAIDSTGIGGAYRLGGFGATPLDYFVNVTFDKNLVQGGFSIDPAPNAGYDYNQESGFEFIFVP
ncbi:hypothetical protein AGMMS50293_31010 [Spirochaetia bacterium]|nr:hypothetical protein AGMMS50293_31010 [Spirochaetia bacterium]